MKLVTSIIMSLSLMASSLPQAEQTAASSRSPAAEAYRQGPAKGNPWHQADLDPRDRSLISLATLIARNHTADMECHLNLALDRGVKPTEISEIITHLAFYAGWSNAMSAAAIAREAFAERGIDAGQFAPALSELVMIIDEIAIDESPVLVRNLWQLPGLAPRDRSLVTVSALAALGKIARADQYLRLIDKAQPGDATH